MLLRLPAPRDYIPVPAPLRNEQRVREDLVPETIRPPRRRNQTARKRKPKNKIAADSQKILPDARRRRTLLAHVAHGNQCWEDASIKANRKPKREAQLQKNSSRRSHSSGNHAPTVATAASCACPTRDSLPPRLRKIPSTPLSASRTGTAYGHPSVRTSCALSDANRGS